MGTRWTLYSCMFRWGRVWLVCGFCVTCNILVHMMLCLPGISDYSVPDRKHQVTDKAMPSPRHRTFLVVAILTGPTYTDRRDTMRNTWLEKLPIDILTFFFIGTRGLSEEDQESLKEENDLHNDLILLPEFEDSYNKLSEKVVKSMQWLHKHVQFSFVLKADDDTFGRINILYQELRDKQPHRYYWGFFDGRARVKKSGPWAEKNWRLCDTYLPHARGGGYVLSSDLVQYISDNGHILQQFNSEDVSVGAWLAPLDIERHHDPRFDTEYKSRGCNNAYIVTHKQDTSNMLVKHQNLLTLGRLCHTESKDRPSYIYDWDAPPSQCCKRSNSSIP